MSIKITMDEIRRWPITVDVPTAAQAIGISRSYAYALAERGEFPCRIIRVGTRYLVPTAGLIALLGGDDHGRQAVAVS